MLPSVASYPQVQPHQHINHYHDSDPINTSYDWNNFAFPPLYHNDPNKNSFQSVRRSRLQYPHPVQRLDLHDFAGPKSSPKNAGEHALRRKTPNGTLAAGYDGTPGDTAIQPPASKHIIVSSLDSGHLLPPQTGLQVDNWQQPPMDQSSVKHLNYPPNRDNVVPDLVPDVNGTAWVRPFNYGPGIDSLLNQNIPLQPSHRFLLQNAPYIPTVLPATLQPCIGPTASAGTGPYGPYWPDGAYIPYRPAALRDSRFTPPNSFAKHLAHGLQFYPQGQSLNWSSIPPGNPPDAGYVWNQPGLGIPSHDASLKSNFPPRHVGQKCHDPQSHRVLTYNTRQNDIGPGFSSRTADSLAWSGPPIGHNFQNSTTPTPSSRTANVEFKEKVLSWAHGVYVDLLATIHQARRNSASNASTDGQAQRLMKPSIYPKPPRQPGLDFSQAMPDMRRHNSYPSSQHDLHSLKQAELPERPSLAQFQHGASDTQMIENLRHTGRFSTSMSSSRFPALTLNENSATANAASALDMLSHLCMESEWGWIDGMLLGGCLAYGLGDYHKAMRWYSRIIARDKTYVTKLPTIYILTIIGTSKLYPILQPLFWLSIGMTRHCSIGCVR